MMKGMIKTGFQKVKNFMSKSKKVVAAAVVGGSAVGVLAISKPASAAVDMTTVTTDITTQFGTIGTAALTVLGAVALTAIVLFGGIYAWKYGKKVFAVIAK